MSAQSVESILSKAMSDATFADPDKALTGCDLTADERAQFMAMTPEERHSFGGVVYERSAGSMNHNQGALRVK